MNREFERTCLFWGKEILRGNLIWPDEMVIRFINRNYKEDKGNTVILDFGCGAGRNSVALASEGYNVVAMDYTEEAILAIESKKRDLTISTIMNNGYDVPLEHDSVDVIIADGSLFYNNIDNTITLLRNLRKTLKKGGKMWSNWRSVEDTMFTRGEQIDNGLYILDNSTGREDCCYLFCKKNDIIYMFEEAGFIIESIDDYMYTEENGNKVNSYYHVIAGK